MPELPSEILDKLTDLQALEPRDRKPSELVAIHWPTPEGLRIYASAAYDEMYGYENLPAQLEADLDYTDPLIVTLIPSNRTPFISLPKTAAVGDDKIDLTFSDLDGEFSTLLMTYGEGIRVVVYGYWPGVDLLLPMWRGSLHAPKELNRSQVKVSVAAGFRSAQLQIPRRPRPYSCTFIFGAHFNSQAEIDYQAGCTYNAHLTEEERGGAPLIGVPGFTDCPRQTAGQCFARLTLPDSEEQTERYWPGFQTRPDAIPNNQTKGPNLLARAYGNESNLNDPIRVIFGYRMVKALNLLAFRPELNNNNPEDGFGAGLFEVGEGPFFALWGFYMMGQLVAEEHQQRRLGELGQLPTNWSPDVNSYSGTGHVWGRVPGDFSEATASDFTAAIWAGGLANIRVYTDEVTFIQIFTKNRMWGLLETYCNPRWGYGVDYSRVDIQSAIDAAAWCDEIVEMIDSNGNSFGGVRSTFNAELTARPTAQVIQDICIAGRIGLPFEWQGKDYFYPLKTESLAGVPTFTDEGASRKILYDKEKSSLSWSQVSDAELTNQYTVNFDAESNDWFVDTQLIFGDQLQQLRAGRAWGDRSRRVIDKKQAAFGITNFLEAARLGNTLLYLGPLDSGGIANNLRVKFQTWHSYAFGLHPYKLIRVLNTKLQAAIHAYTNARDFYWYAGTPYTYFRVLKIERKGDLKVEIEAQLYPQDWYAIIDGPDEIPCTINYAHDLIYDELNNFEQQTDLSGIRDGGTPGSSDSWARSGSLVDGESCATWEWVIDELAESDEIYVVIEDENAGPDKYGWKFTNSIVNYRRAPRHGVTEDFPIHYQNTDNGGFHRFSIHYDNGSVELYESAQLDADPSAPLQASPSYSYSGLDTNVAWRLRVYVISSAGRIPPIREADRTLGSPPALPTVPGDPDLSLDLEITEGVLEASVIIRGTVEFPSFPGPLRAVVYVTPPGGVETEYLNNLSPPVGTTSAQFSYTPVPDGEYAFRVVLWSTTDPPVEGGDDTESITVVRPTALIDRDGEPLYDRDGSAVYDRSL